MNITHLALGASFLASLMTAPALAASYHTSGDVTAFDSNGSQTFLAGSGYNLGNILAGSASAPKGNLELNDGSASANLLAPANTLTATLDSGRQVTFSSLTSDDWFGSGNLAQTWFADAMNAYGSTISTRFKTYLVGQGYSQQSANFAASNSGLIFSAFAQQGGFARLSDPNIAYVNESDAGVTFGLAGHSDAGNINSLLSGLYASEVVKVLFNGETNYYYSFAQPTASGQVSREDGVSHSGNHEFFISDPKTPESVPEPASVLGLMALGGWIVAGKRKAMA